MGIIRIATTDEEIRRTHRVMAQLHPNVPQASADYLGYVRSLQAEAGFRLATLTEEGEVICVAGFRICRNLGWGKFLYIDDLVTDEQARSKGVGKVMLSWLIAHARAENCADLRLDTRVDRKDAQRFYLREGMEIFAYHFRLALERFDRN